ncbi:hypothetical protein AAHC03_09971 [Spirometra sp. Aus1]
MKLQQKLDTAVSKNEVISLRIDNACELSRIENRGRREMLQLWENTVAQMAARDEDYADLGKQYDDKLNELQNARARLLELEKLLASIVQDIADAKKKRHQLNKQAGDLHDQVLKETDELTTTENDLLTLKKTVEKTSKDLQVAKAENRQLGEDLNRMKSHILDIEDTIAKLKKKLAEVHSDKLSAEELLQMAEEQLDSEADCQKRMRKKLEKLKVQRFELVEELEKLDKLIYNALLFGHSLEQRISRLEESTAVDEEGAAMEKRIKVLQEELDSRVKSAKILTKMIDQFLNEKQILHMRIAKIKEELALRNDQMDSTRVTILSTQRYMDATTREKNELLVFYNMSRYQLRRTEARLKMTEESTLSAEMQLQTLFALNRELQEESAARMYSLEMELRQVKADYSRINADLTKRKLRLDQLVTRYNLESVGTMPQSEDGSTEKAQFIVKALTEHEELRCKGDELDKAVRTAEEELRALENTVLVMVSLNESARGFVAPTTNPQFEEEKKKLKEILEESEKVMKQARENRRVFRASVLRFTVEMSTLDDEARRLDETAAAHELELMRMTDKNAELEERLSRAERNLTMAMDKVTHSKSKAELDISVQLLCDFNEALNMLLVRCIRGSPFLTEEVLKRAQELFDSFQLGTPILVGNLANIKQSERAMKNIKSSNVSNSVTAAVVQLNPDNLIEQAAGSRGSSLGSLTPRGQVAPPVPLPTRRDLVSRTTPLSSRSGSGGELLALRIDSRSISAASRASSSSTPTNRSVK